MSHATKIIDGKFGGTRKAASLLKLAPSTVQSWKDAGLIPAKHQQQVLDVARSHAIDLSPEDFFELDVEAPQGEAESSGKAA